MLCDVLPHFIELTYLYKVFIIAIQGVTDTVTVHIRSHFFNKQPAAWHKTKRHQCSLTKLLFLC